MIYTYKCVDCGEFDRYMSIKNHMNTAVCECGSLCNQVIYPPKLMIIPPEIRYTSPIDGRVITNKQQRINDLANNKCVEYEPGMRQDADRRLKDDDARLDKQVHEIVSKEIETMPYKKRQALESELSWNVDVVAVRQ